MAGSLAGGGVCTKTLGCKPFLHSSSVSPSLSLDKVACRTESPRGCFSGISVSVLIIVLGICVTVSIVFIIADTREDPECTQYFSPQQALLHPLLGPGASVCLTLESRERVLAGAAGLGHTFKLSLVLSSSGWSLCMCQSMCVLSSPG